MPSAPRRIVFDTSALIGAVLRPRSLPASALALASLAGELMVSVETLAELTEVLQRPHLNRYRSLEERLLFLEHYRTLATVHEVTTVVTDCRDPKDNKFLSLAVSANASVIVASDEDLRVLHPYRHIPILTPTQFVDQARTFWVD